MIAKLLVLGLFHGMPLRCGGQPATMPSEAVSLLQTSVEMKKTEAETTKSAKLAREPHEYGTDACNIVASGQTEAADKTYSSVHATAKIETDMPEAADYSSAAADATANIETDIPKASAGSDIVRIVLQALAILLIMDGLRRWTSKDTSAKPVTVPVSSKTSTPVAPSPALLTAALEGNADAFEASIGSSLSTLSLVDSWGCSVLHYAAKGGSVHILQRLLDLGAKVDALDAWDETPLHLAARAGHGEACQTLLEARARIDATNAEEFTPLVVAGQAEHKAICTLLIERGAGVAGLPNEEVPDLVKRLLQATEL